ncbi:MAG: hypothetical protein LH606_01585 [Cytophagaceae bacterium]|nr:hypothetical protein [Cytophagaceae bacterium]
MNLETKKHLIPELLRKQFLVWAQLETEAEQEAFWQQSKLETAAKSEAERAELEKAWLDGVEIIRQEVRAIGEEIKAAKTPA